VCSLTWSLLDFDRRAVIASLASAELADRIGRKIVVAGALAISFVAVAIEFIATTNAVFFTGKLLNGFAVGVFQTVMITYIGEVRRRRQDG